MGIDLRKESKFKLALAGAGLLTIVGVAAGTVFAVVSHEPPKVSELALHPERQDEILSQREAEDYRKQLGLSEEQTKKIADLLLTNRKHAIEARANANGDPRQMMAGMMGRGKLNDVIRDVLTPEQQAKFDETPAGKRRQMMQTMMNATPEQRDAFRKQMQDRMGPGGGQGFPGFGPGRGPGFGPGAPPAR